MDLNIDIGEIDARREHQLLSYVTSCNVSCGAHAGDPPLIVSTIRAALHHNVNVGAHPSYPDRKNFGRLSIALPSVDLMDHLRFQICAVRGTVESLGGRLCHVKPHGALYHDLQNEPVLARTFAQLIKSIDDRLKIVGQPNSQLANEAQAEGLTFLAEAFADRRYESATQLRLRTQDDAMLKTREEVRKQIQSLQRGVITDASGRQHELKADTICLHGDGPLALEFVQIAHETLQSNC